MNATSISQEPIIIDLKVNKVFQKKELFKPNLFQRIFKQNPPENALIEINNLLASKRIVEVSVEDVSAIGEKYKLNLYQTFQKNFLEMYAAQLKFALLDNKLTNEELDDLRALKEILGLQQFQVNSIHEKLAGEIYRREVLGSVGDGKITNEEKNSLKKLEAELCISKDLEKRISDEVKSTYVEQFIDGIIKSGSYSPQEEEDIKILAKNLNYDLKISSSQQNTLNRLKLIWVIENGELQTIDVPINLTSNEKCFFTKVAKWYQYKTVTQRINYAGPTARIRICKGVSYRIGSARVQRVTSEVLSPIDAGTMYVTNKRVILLGARKTSSIRLNKIVSYTPYSNGIEIFKDTGKSMTVTFDTDMDLFNLLFSRILRES